MLKLPLIKSSSCLEGILTMSMVLFKLSSSLLFFLIQKIKESTAAEAKTLMFERSTSFSIMLL